MTIGLVVWYNADISDKASQDGARPRMLSTIEYNATAIGHWADKPLRSIATRWVSRARRRLGAADERSSWWSFIHDWRSKAHHWLAACRTGQHRFSPLVQYRVSGQTLQCWCYLDRLVIHLLLQLINPTIKNITIELWKIIRLFD